MTWRDELWRERQADPSFEARALAFIWIPATIVVALLIINNSLLLLHGDGSICP